MSTATVTGNALEVRDVVKRFGGVVALNGVSMTVPRGQVTALVGDNGAGKSTLVRCLSGVHEPDEGEILVSGDRAVFGSPLGARAFGIETVFQELALADNLDVSANIFLGRELRHGWAGLYRLKKKEMARRSEELLQRYAINMPSANAPVRRLSGGQRQGVAIARAVGTGHTHAVLMDEPTAALGVQETAKVLGIVRALADSGLGVLLISHNMQQVIDTADQVYVLRGGRMVAGMRTADTSTQELVHYITTGVGLRESN
ncbi:ATP-binding cassette domain-containing protein [Leifsonia sp. Root227]|uniref:ATP-binding cassette domain-containing protein n=1 Tax=Leifsonia sp. Root227 TaxID=1736496 RepID=UPI000AF69E11|nr:ATP-binding cassette domain-containing protein [Leifsonia sp. Root227]